MLLTHTHTHCKSKTRTCAGPVSPSLINFRLHMPPLKLQRFKPAVDDAILEERTAKQTQIYGANTCARDATQRRTIRASQTQDTIQHGTQQCTRDAAQLPTHPRYDIPISLWICQRLARAPRNLSIWRGVKVASPRAAAVDHQGFTGWHRRRLLCG